MKLKSIIFLAVTIALTIPTQSTAMQRIKPVLLIISANGYQPTEFAHAQRALKISGYKVTIASNAVNENGQPTRVLLDGAKGMVSDEAEAPFGQTPVDITLSEVDVDNYAGIFFIGGPLVLQNLENRLTAPESYRIARQTVASRIPLGAISFTPRILARSGVLEGENATGWNGDNKLGNVFQKNGVQLIDNPAEGVVFADDLPIVTSVGRETAAEFGAAIVSLLDNFWGIRR